jgi:uncharacterized membrane protein
LGNWLHIAPTVSAAFLGSLVEFVEALTIVLAVGTVRGWRSALAGTAAGAGLLILLILLLGPALALIPLGALRMAVGILLLLFGMRWLRKAILRAGGLIPIHDEAAAFAAESAELSARGKGPSPALDPVAVATAFKAVALEGVEVVFIVVAVGSAGGMLLPASLAAGLAGLLVVALGLALHRPLARVPENALKFAVGVLISAFGVFWMGEGLGLAWPGQDLAIPGLAIGMFLTAFLAVRFVRNGIPVVAGRSG